ncbi:hypothetical protein [Escherichia coli]|nr:hypothetical protein [Escherichia coli]
MTHNYLSRDLADGQNALMCMAASPTAEPLICHSADISIAAA